MAAAIQLWMNGEQLIIASADEPDTIFENRSDKQFVEYRISGHGETSVLLFVNASKATGIFLRFPGDSGLTTYDPKETDDMQDFILSNGQRDEYPARLTINKQAGLLILKHYWLTGEKYNHIEWREE